MGLLCVAVVGAGAPGPPATWAGPAASEAPRGPRPRVHPEGAGGGVSAGGSRSRGRWPSSPRLPLLAGGRVFPAPKLNVQNKRTKRRRERASRGAPAEERGPHYPPGPGSARPSGTLQGPPPPAASPERVPPKSAFSPLGRLRFYRVVTPPPSLPPKKAVASRGPFLSTRRGDRLCNKAPSGSGEQTPNQKRLALLIREKQKANPPRTFL